MTSVSVEPAALTTAAARTRSVGAQIAAYATAGRVEAATLMSAFGLMGAEFAAAAVTVTDRHSSELTDLAARIDALAAGLQHPPPHIRAPMTAAHNRSASSTPRRCR